ncbi:MAG: alkaline phosphatase family protein [Elusimicrobia bacterium]|nr:alkaline phosphatase family protein [Elusimicrobiota bacterium]
MGYAHPQTPPAGAGPRNALLIGWDGVSRSRLEELLAKGRLPNLQALAAEGALVDIEVTTGATSTKPGWVEILSGYRAGRLGTPNNKTYRPIPEGYTIFERLKGHFGKEGIATAFLGGKQNNIGDRGPHEICSNCFGYDYRSRKLTYWWDRERCTAQTTDGKPRRWVHRDGEPYHKTKAAVDVFAIGLGPGEKVEAAAEAFLKEQRGRRFFGFFHFEDPDKQGHLHGENSPEYGRGIEEADRQLGAIVKALRARGLYEQTTIWVVSDHGFDPDTSDHHHASQIFLATNSKRKIRAGDRKDITPTILDDYGVPGADIQPPWDGKSLFLGSP